MNNVITIPFDLNKMVADAAERQGVSVDQYVVYVLTKDSLSVLNDPISARLQNKNEDEIMERFANILSRVPDREPPEWDKLPPV